MRIAACLLALTCSLPLALPLACGGGTPPPKGEDEAVASSSASPGDTAPADTSAAAGAASAGPADTSAPAASAAPASTGDSNADLKAPKEDTWSAGHQIPAGEVTKTIKAHQKQVQACYTKAKKKDPSVSGEVKLKFIISNDGKVKDWKDDSSTMSNEDVTKCVGGVIKGLKFPKQKSPGDAWGTYNISF
jgi:hypothetical protein